jgi:hypothetical protein
MTSHRVIRTNSPARIATTPHRFENEFSKATKCPAVLHSLCSACQITCILAIASAGAGGLFPRIDSNQRQLSVAKAGVTGSCRGRGHFVKQAPPHALVSRFGSATGFDSADPR